MCFECLRRQIRSDFSENLNFNYAISTSALPFASSAVVQISNSDGGEASASASPPAQFELVYIPTRRGDDCLANYIEECCLEHLNDNHTSGKENAPSSVISQDQVEVSIGIPCDETTSLQTKSYESQCFSTGGRNYSLPGLGCKSLTCQFSGRFSCLRTITALAPVSQIGILSYSVFEEVASQYLSGLVEDHVLCSLSLLIEGKATARDGINFLSLIGIPSFDDNSFPGCIRHPNIVPILGMMKSSSHISLVLPKASYTLENILHYSPSALNSDWHIKFIIYQLLSALVQMHGLGIVHGSVCPSNVLLTDSLWCWLHIGDKLKLSSNVISNSRNKECVITPVGCSMKDCYSSGLYADLKLSESIDWHSGFRSWWRGELSNFEYLLLLNRLAGRRWGDHTFHTVMPWVIDFSVKPDEKNDAGWRDLSKSKWRLAKGDEQLDFTYSTSEIPHHVSDECLSELAVCSYKARRLPLSVLRMAVRSVYEPNEYPSTMQRLYQWTPDECIPEFYLDPQIFRSRHSGMSDLAVPSWAGSVEEFIKLHRNALESDRVSSQIHNWIDITFGYKMSGQEAVAAKNVMLAPSEPRIPRSVGRRQLFNQPHPARHSISLKARESTYESATQHGQVNGIQREKPLLCGAAYLNELEEAAGFCEHSLHLSPLYYTDEFAKDSSSLEDPPSSSIINRSGVPGYGRNSRMPLIIDLNYLLESIELEDNSPAGYQELFLWRQKSASLSNLSEDIARDIFSVGCILAELYLRRPLFDVTSLSTYLESGISPKSMKELPPQVEVLVEACIQKDKNRRPSAKSLLESPYFPATIRSSYLFLAPLQLLSKDGTRLHYAASFVKRGVLRDMGKFAAEMCAPYCLPLLLTPLSDTEAECAYIILKEFLNCLNLEAIKTLVLPCVQKILQVTGYSHMKVSLLQDSFVQELWSSIGKQEYLEKVHQIVLSNLYVAPHKSSASAASVLLIGSSEELGVPITVHQTILPLIHRFGKGLCNEGIDVVVRIGGLFGEEFIVRQIVPLIRNVVHSCIGVSFVNKSETVQSWNALALMDCLMTLDGVAALLPTEVVVKELIEDGSCLYIQVLMQANLGIPVLQAAATSLVAVSQQIGPDLTALHVMPKLKELFDELVFSQKTYSGSGSLGGSLKASKKKAENDQIENRMNLVLLLYPPFASLLGIEKLRQCCATWLILEQFLLRHHGWKCEYPSEASHNDPENINSRRSSFGKCSSSEYTSSRMLLNSFGRSIPQSQGNKGSKHAMKRLYDHHQNPMRNVSSSYVGNKEPWHWFPSPASSWDGPDFVRRVGGSNNEIPWKMNASVIQSVRAHHGALRSFAVCQDERTVLTAGVGPGFKGTVLKWDLSRIDSLSGYHGHDEVVNDICVLASSDRVASCDGTIHVWNSQTEKLICIFAEFSENSAQVANPLTSVSRINSDQANMLNFNPLSNGILSTALDGSLYTSMHYLQNDNSLVVGTGNGSLRFIDVIQGQKLHLWKSESVESNFPCLVSSICSSGSDKMQAGGSATSTSWIAAGLSSGKCRLLDRRSGNIIASWQAHDGYVTKLAAPEDHLIVSSSLDKTIRVWDLRRNWASEPVVFRGHNDSVSGFSVWGQDVISISRNKIGLSSLSRSASDDGQHRITPQHLYTADRESRNVSILSSITILPFSRLFLVGTEDGHLKICS